MSRPIVIVIAFVVLAGCGAEADEDSQTTGPPPAESVIQVIGEVCRRDAQGSGIIVGPDLVVTSAHTLAGSTGGLQVRRPEQAPVAATLVGFDPDRDLALLRAPDIGGQPVVLANPVAGATGSIGTVNVDGSLELLEYSVDRLVTANSGDIYDEGEVVRSALQLSASTLPGDSGGALFDSADRVIGIVFAQSRGDVPVAYAVATEEVAAFLEEVDPTSEVPAGRCR